MRVALTAESGDVVNVVELPDGEPDPIPVFEDGEQVWDETLGEDGEVIERTPRMQAAPPWAPPEGLAAVPLDEDSRVGIGWRYVDGDWVEPAPDLAPEPVVDDRVLRLAQVLADAGVTEDQIREVLG